MRSTKVPPISRVDCMHQLIADFEGKHVEQQGRLDVFWTSRRWSTFDGRSGHCYGLIALVHDMSHSIQQAAGESKGKAGMPGMSDQSENSSRHGDGRRLPKSCCRSARPSSDPRSPNASPQLPKRLRLAARIWATSASPTLPREYSERRGGISEVHSI